MAVRSFRLRKWHSCRQALNKESINEAFFNFDLDKDGYISVEDLIVVMMTKGAKMNQQEATEFAREVDFDGDGQIYYPEVADYLLSGE